MTLCATSHEKEFHLGTFPGNFQLGVIPSAHSTEGALDEGRSPVYSMIFPFIILSFGLLDKLIMKGILISTVL